MAVLVAALSGCAAQVLLPYEPTVANEATLGSLPREARFQVTTSGREPSDVATTVRTLHVSAPGDGSWSAYLAQALRTELAASSHYDENAALILDASLTQVHINDGAAAVTAHFVVRDAQGVRYDKVLHVDTRWDSDFIGVIAGSNGMNQATAIFEALLQKLYADADFVKAARSA
jgi:hypothetical protein